MCFKLNPPPGLELNGVFRGLILIRDWGLGDRKYFCKFSHYFVKAIKCHLRGSNKGTRHEKDIEFLKHVIFRGLVHFFIVSQGLQDSRPLSFTHRRSSSLVVICREIVSTFLQIPA